MKGYSELVVRGLYGRKFGKLLRKNMRKPYFRGREGRKVTNRPRAVGVPVSFASKKNPNLFLKWELVNVNSLFPWVGGV